MAEERFTQQCETVGAALARATERLPPDISSDLAENLGVYWRERLRQHTGDSYAGVTLSKLPEDLSTYEHLLWSDRPDTVVEIGTQYGASALWFRDRLRALQSYGLIDQPRVVTLDIDQSLARRYLHEVDPSYEATIHLLEGDIRDSAVVDQIRERVGTRCFVVEDSAHEYDTTYASLSAVWDLVPPGGYFIVEDGSVDIDALRVDDEWPRGVLPALHDWLQTPEGRGFYVRRDLELYGVTSHPQGFLQRRVDETQPLPPNLHHGAAVRVIGLDVARPEVQSLAERQLTAEIVGLRSEIAILESRLSEINRVEELLLDAEQRVATVPDLQSQVADLERELDEARRTAEEARAAARALDARLSVGEQVLADVLSSPSWRVTKPLRAVKHVLGPHLGRLRGR